MRGALLPLLLLRDAVAAGSASEVVAAQVDTDDGHLPSTP